jgi:hypothetical protein
MCENLHVENIAGNNGIRKIIGTWENTLLRRAITEDSTYQHFEIDAKIF